MMRSPPMFLEEATDKWPFLAEQMPFAQTKDMFMVFIAFAGFWCSQYAIGEYESGYHNKHTIRTVTSIVFVVVCIVDFVWQSVHGWAAGSYTTAIAFFVGCGLIILLEYAFKTDIHPGDHKDTHADKKTEPGAIEAQPVQSEHVAISTPKREHMRRNIYLSYACLLMLPPVVLFILSHTHDAIFDVHVQLAFFSFLFYATLDVFQTRTTAVLMCIRDKEDAMTRELHLVQVFVVLAFFLCKCFVLMPSLVLLQTQYKERTFQLTTLAVHYVLLFGFALADLVHIVFKMSSMDLIKLFAMLVYTCFIFFAAVVVDAPVAASPVVA